MPSVTHPRPESAAGFREPAAAVAAAARLRRRFDLLGACAVASLVVAVVASSEAVRWRSRSVDVRPDAAALAAGFRPGTSWYGLYRDTEPIGFSRVDRLTTDDGFRMRSLTILRLRLLGEPARTTLEVEVDLSETMAVRGFRVRAGDDLVSAEGRVAGDRLDLLIRVGDAIQRTSRPLDRVPVLDLNLHPVLLRRGLDPGSRVTVETFDPLTMATRRVVVTYLGRTPLTVLGETISAHHFRTVLDLGSFDSWVNDLGEVLQQELPIGVVARLETEAEATWQAGSAARAEGTPAPGLPAPALRDQPG